MVREYPALVITDGRDQSKNSGNPAFAHLNLCPATTSCAQWKETLVITKYLYITVSTLRPTYPSSLPLNSLIIPYIHLKPLNIIKYLTNPLPSKHYSQR